eukprot:CAMPEP_0194108142 /NCGR_PEP_ID=MMETSP0150-20130528/7893_1 /TAXON_ID=122233 /ORGANISM="Chaetoceros debilis, Strain MM31A-1" /LENGTH=388 /DNA_ID=CAMNT_0038796769 /DNA_START=13 /DNA_END=1179 /DNA_ORIENTATION=+
MTITADDLIAKLQHCKDFPSSFKARMDAVAAKAVEEMTKEAGKFLFELDDRKHTEQQVKAIIDAFPESLSMQDKHSLLPVQRAAWLYSVGMVSFIPLLAKEGLRLNVGGEESRGGLLHGRNNTLVDLARCEEPNVKCKQVLEELREMGLFKKEDIQNFDLLSYSLSRYSAPLFEMLAAWDPYSLITTTGVDGCPLIHDPFSEEDFEMILKAGMEHFPERLGFLFQKYKGKTACENAFDDFGVNEAMAVICKCIPPFENHALIHRAVEVAPHLEDKLIKYYPNEAFKRDATGRTLPQVKFHAQLRRGTQTYDSTASFFANAIDDQIEAKDPRLGVFPFMVAASDNRSDLDAVYYLLRRCPQVLVNLRERDDRDVEDVQQGSRKRQREES